MANLEKANGFERVQNWPQTLRHAEVAATKLKQLKNRPVVDIDEALSLKYEALAYMARHKEALECAKEWYCMYPTNHTHPPAINASFFLIESCGFNNEFFDAALYARTLWETITLSRDSHIPDNRREQFTARGAIELAQALWKLAEHGGMPAEEQQVAGQEAIMLARKALEIYTQLFGAESKEVANSMCVVAGALDFFNDVDDDEVLRLYEQTIVISVHVLGKLSMNVAVGENNLGSTYKQRARRAYTAHDLDRCVVNLELALSHLREAARIYRAINHMDNADKTAQDIAKVEEMLRGAKALLL